MFKGPIAFPLYSTGICSPSNRQYHGALAELDHSLLKKKAIFTVVFLNYTSQSKKKQSLTADCFSFPEIGGDSPPIGLLRLHSYVCPACWELGALRFFLCFVPLLITPHLFVDRAWC